MSLRSWKETETEGGWGGGGGERQRQKAEGGGGEIKVHASVLNDALRRL